ncbi:unnamed protein product [Ixodes persulcatus]
MSDWSQLSLGRKAGYAFAALSLVLVFIAFTTPYWLASDPRIYSAQLLRLGLWEACFRSFSNPNDLNMEKFYVGCRWVLTYEYNTLRDFIETPFFVAVQVFFTIGFTVLLLACVVLLAMHICLPAARAFQMLKVVIALLIASAIPLFLSVAVFGGMCFERSWLQNPIYNHLSWAYALAVVAFFFHTVAAMMLLGETLKARERRRRANNLIYNMQPRS